MIQSRRRPVHELRALSTDLYSKVAPAAHVTVDSNRRPQRTHHVMLSRSDEHSLGRRFIEGVSIRIVTKYKAIVPIISRWRRR